MKCTLRYLAVLSMSMSFAIIIDERQMKEHHPTLSKFVDDIEYKISWLKNPLFAWVASKCLGSVNDDEVKFLERYFKEKEEKEKSIDKVLCFTENVSYLQGIFIELPEKATVEDLKLRLEQCTKNRINPEQFKDQHKEYFDCITCNLFSMHILEHLKNKGM